ncbi:acid phosphatase type 7-like isoform X1 [Convolutriloba macropyga]|uniref:acid phosphatase type 7-like isoform X1 n=1 Tax=Convolutriloba macropyga TaxID=536237 RepID=UPI003F524132
MRTIFPCYLIFAVYLPASDGSIGTEDYSLPEQIHLSYTGNQSSMYVTWTTLAYIGEGSVTYHAVVNSSSLPDQSVNASMTRMRHYKDANSSLEVYRTTWTFRATMVDLKENTTYEYVLQNGKVKVGPYQFRTFPADGSGFLPTVAVFGDMGVENHVSLDKLMQDREKGVYDLVWHIGDIAYNMNELMGARGDMFMRLVQPIASRVPYSVIPGNHEKTNNFSEYRNKFTSPPPSVFYHSYNVGPIHLIMFTTEFYIYDEFGLGQLQAQYNWLVADLKKANEREARKKHPWIVTAGHRPMYCSAKDNLDCDKDNPIRTGYQNKFYKLEDLFYQNGVDIQLYGHKHNYERMYPIYNYTWERVDNPKLYQDPTYPVHVISGSAGNREIHPPLSYPEPEWSYFRKNEYGFAYLKVLDRLAIEISQYSIDFGGYIDSFVLKKSQDYPSFYPVS